MSDDEEAIGAKGAAANGIETTGGNTTALEDEAATATGSSMLKVLLTETGLSMGKVLEILMGRSMGKVF